MSRAYTKDICVLAVDPSTRGFGFAVLEGPNRFIDWGVKETKTDKKRRSLKLIDDLIERYQPSVVVVEDYAGKGSRRCRRVRELIETIRKIAEERKLSQKLTDEVVSSYLIEPEKNRFGVINAFTNAAQRLAPLQRIEMERFAGTLLVARLN
jgi:RNase H-fold protein (predicted Holliday junction resolvase)